MALLEDFATIRLNLGLQDWLDTGFDIPPENSVRITAAGIGGGGAHYKVQPCYPEGCYDGETVDEYDPIGNPPDLYPLGPGTDGGNTCWPAPTFCLLVAIKNTPGPPSVYGTSYRDAFYIGRDRTIVPGEHYGGRVWLVFNDGWGGFFDNTGYFDVTMGPQCSHVYGRYMDDELEAEFKASTGRYAFLLAIEPEGRPAEGYTNFDRDLNFPDILDDTGNLMVPALLYKSENDVLPTEIPQNSGGSDDTVDVITAIVEANRIKWENEYYDNATVSLMACKWDDSEVKPLILMSGTVGKGQLGDTSAKVELRPWTHLLQRNILRIVAPICDCPLYARGACAGNGEDPSAPQIEDLTFPGTIVAVSGKDGFKIDGIDKPDGWADFGRVYFAGDSPGDNEGATPRSVKKWSADGTVLLHTGFPHMPQVGDTVMVEEGCDRLWETCQIKNNTDNFQGFPHLPGRQGVVRRYQT